MKIAILLFASFLSTTIGLSQSLEGEWKGSFTDNTRGNTYETEIIFYFSKVNDTSFEGISRTVVKYNKKESDTAVCVLRGGFYEKNILYLEETRSIKDFANTEGCLQSMKLYYRKKKNYLELKGDWNTNDVTCGSGYIRLTKPY